MLGVDHLPLFVLSGLLLNITPGQDTFYIIGRTLAHGRQAGFFAVLGILTGCLVHTLAAALGLSALLATSAGAYQGVKLAGAAYLIYIGLTLMIQRGTSSNQFVQDDNSHGSAGEVFRGGLLSNVLNPKTALFFVALLPQFVTPAAESRTLAFLFLGVLFVVNSLPWCCVLVWAASAMRRRVLAERSMQLLKRVTGGLFVGLGVRLSLSR